MKKFVSLFVLACFMLITLSACNSSDLDYIKGKDKLIIGITEYENMHMQTSDGEWIGFDAEFAQLVAERLDLSVEFKVIMWDEKVDLLDSKEIDCIWNGYTINEVDDVKFSEPYAKNSQVLIIPTGHEDTYNSIEDIINLNLAVEKGSSSERLLKERAPQVKVSTYASQKDCILAVSKGEVEGCVVDKVIFDSLVHTDLYCAAVLGVEQFGIGFRKNSDAVNEINNIIKELRENGSLSKLAEKYDIELTE